MNKLKNKVEIDTSECHVIEIEKGRFELFKPIQGHDSKYMVSTNGTVISLHYGKIRIMKLRTDKDGYRHVTLSANGTGKSFLVHRLVAEAFLYDFDKSLEVDHIDGCRWNNQIENLQMLSHKDNVKKRDKKRKKYVRLSQEEKQLIRDNYIPRDKKYGFKAIQNKYDLSGETMKKIIYG